MCVCMCVCLCVFKFVLCVKWQQLTLDIFMLGPEAKRCLLNCALCPARQQQRQQQQQEHQLTGGAAIKTTTITTTITTTTATIKARPIPIDMTTMFRKLLTLFIKRFSLRWAWHQLESCVDHKHRNGAEAVGLAQVCWACIRLKVSNKYLKIISSSCQ